MREMRGVLAGGKGRQGEVGEMRMIAEGSFARSCQESSDEPWRVESLRKSILDYFDAFCKTVVAKNFDYDEHSRQIGIVFPVSALGAPAYGDFIPQVAHALQNERTQKGETGIQTATRDFRRCIRSHGIGSAESYGPRSRQTMRCQVLRRYLENKQRRGCPKGIPLGQLLLKRKGIRDDLD